MCSERDAAEKGVTKRIVHHVELRVSRIEKSREAERRRGTVTE